MEQHRPSLRDIARRLNVSHATVSMALRNNPRISEKRREEVRKVADEIGYRPDPMLSSLVAYRQRKQEKPLVSVLAWVNRWPDPKKLRQYKEFESYWQGACKAAEALGYKLEEFVVNDDLRGHRLNDILLSRGIQGILIPPHSSSDSWIDLGLDWKKFSVVRFGFSISDLRAHMIGGDQMRSSELAVKKMSEAGYRSIGYLTNYPFDFKTGGNFRMGYLRGIELDDRLARVEPLLLREPMIRGQSKLEREKALSEILNWIEDSRLDAVFTSEIGLASALSEAGVKVPEDIALAATSVRECDGISAGIDQNPFVIGEVAVQVLVSRLNRNDTGEPQFCRRVLVEGDWTSGETLPTVEL
ncbi:LacI family transcriptional regulator [Puniceicoccaceae bacterium K14]|nr:LacI family transcriptional regulator [Puniceicoccaceae bacterium K14]